MRRNGFAIGLLALCLLLPLPSYAQLQGSDTVPGSACSAKGAVRMTANADGPGAYILTCDGDSGHWVATINAVLPTANAQVANKEYVDNAVAAGVLPVCSDDYASLCALETNRAGNDPEFTPGNIATGVKILGITGTLTSSAPSCTNDSTVLCTLAATRSSSDAQFVASNIVSGVNILGVIGTAATGGSLSGPAGCTSIGDLCANGTVFAGWHPITQEQLFIPPTDADSSATMAWKTATGTNDIATDSTYDGRVNTNQVANSTDFPAFKACKDLTLAGKNWYLPSQVELYYLWSIHETIEAKGNITNFQNAYYWSSTEYFTNNAWGQIFTNGIQNFNNKNNVYRVRCVWR
ncbi:DUF1566 domain-containing protein [Pseudomonas aeruginosa]|uniref:Lcl domain-containing protein n=1 Tax=Pseudomonas aeruginosa TaxID=287 RepID=UPI00374A6389